VLASQQFLFGCGKFRVAQYARGVHLRQLLQLRRHVGARSRHGGRWQGLRRRLLHVDNLGLLRIRALLLIVHRLLLGVLLRILLLVVMIHGAADRGCRPPDDCRSHGGVDYRSSSHS
jgi:hypothetical protein